MHAKGITNNIEVSNIILGSHGVVTLVRYSIPNSPNSPKMLGRLGMLGLCIFTNKPMGWITYYLLPIGNHPVM